MTMTSNFDKNILSKNPRPVSPEFLSMLFYLGFLLLLLLTAAQLEINGFGAFVVPLVYVDIIISVGIFFIQNYRRSLYYKRFPKSFANQDVPAKIAFIIGSSIELIIFIYLGSSITSSIFYIFALTIGSFIVLLITCIVYLPTVVIVHNKQLHIQEKKLQFISEKTNNQLLSNKDQNENSAVQNTDQSKFNLQTNSYDKSINSSLEPLTKSDTENSQLKRTITGLDKIISPETNSLPAPSNQPQSIRLSSISSAEVSKFRKATITCSFCQNIIPSESKFCPRCGHILKNRPFISLASENNKPDLPTSTNTHDSKKSFNNHTINSPRLYTGPLNIQENLSGANSETTTKKLTGWLFLVGITFLILASFVWILLIFPQTTSLSIGQLTWIAGDTITILGIFIILIAEFIISNIKLGKNTGLKYIISGIGFFIGLIGLGIMRFQTLPDYLPSLGIISSYWLLISFGVLLGVIAWAYAWMTPYREFLLVLEVSCFIFVDYSLGTPLGSNWLLLLPLFIGLLLLWLPGMHAIFRTQPDYKFLFAGIITQSLIFFRIENSLTIIHFEPFLLVLILLLPVVFIVFVMLVKHPDPLWQIILPASLFGNLFLGELLVFNTYLDPNYLVFLLIATFILLFIPILKNRQSILNETFLIIIGGIINLHSLLYFLDSLRIQLYYGSIILLLLGLLTLWIFPYRKIKQISTRLLGFIWVYSSTGIFLSIQNWIFVLYLFAIIIGLRSIKDKQLVPWQETLIYFFSPLGVVVAGSTLSYVNFWNILTIPIMFVIIFSLQLLHKLPTTVTITGLSWITTLLALNALIWTQPIYANYLLVEYYLLIIGAFCYVWLKKDLIKQAPIFLWFFPIIGFLSTALISDYDQWLFLSLLIIIIICTFITITRVFNQLTVKKTRQFLYDSTIVIICFSIFTYMILENFGQNRFSPVTINVFGSSFTLPFEQFSFLLLLGLILLLNASILFYILRFSGMDLTLPIIIPSLLLIIKELYFNQFIQLKMSPEFSLLGFSLIVMHSTFVALISRRSDEELNPLITPTVTAMFSTDLVLLILYLNQVLIDNIGLLSYLVILVVNMLIVLPKRHFLTHIEFTILQLITFFLGLTLHISSTILLPLLYLVLLSLLLSWIIQRARVYNPLILLDIVVFGVLSITIYLWSVRVPIDSIFSVGTFFLCIQIFVGSIWLIFNTIRSHRFIKNVYFDKFYTSLWIQLPACAVVILFYDLFTNSHLLWSQFINFIPSNVVLALPVLTAGLILLSLFWFPIDEKDITIRLEYYAVAVFLQFTLINAVVQLLIESWTNDMIVNGILLSVIGLCITFIACIEIYRQRRIVFANSVLFTAITYMFIFNIIYLQSSGLLVGYWAVISTAIMLLGLFKPVRRENIAIGVLLLVGSILKIGFDILMNFDRLEIEIAVSSTILAFCLIIIAYTLNIYSKRNITS